MIDDSSSMTPLQTKMQARLPDFMNVLKGLSGGLPNLHIAVVSSSLGAGVFANVPGCYPGPPGNDDGLFIHLPTCTALNAGQTFITASQDGKMNNFTGDISSLFSCMALLGDNGCGFEHQLESSVLALQRAMLDGDPNSGFLRPDAYFALVMLTNEDDSSVPVDSKLYDPSVISVNDPSGLGGLQSYRQNEFGHLCNGMKIPHLPPAMPVTLNNCASDEDPDPAYADKLHEVRVKDYVDFFSGLKPGEPDKVLVAAIAGPPTPYVVTSKSFLLSNGSMELQPVMQHSCMQNSGEYADPAVRITQFLNAFGTNAVFETICAGDFQPAMMAIASAIGNKLEAQCVNGTVVTDPNTGNPDCEVTEQATGGAAVVIPACDAGTSNFPCWKLIADAKACPKGMRGQVCRDSVCDPNNHPTDPRTAYFACSLARP